MRDVYAARALLGVPEHATAATLRTAHRAAAKKFHPDRPTGDAHKFVAAQHAYELLLTNPSAEHQQQHSARHEMYVEDSGTDWGVIGARIGSALRAALVAGIILWAWSSGVPDTILNALLLTHSSSGAPVFTATTGLSASTALVGYMAAVMAVAALFTYRPRHRIRRPGIAMHTILVVITVSLCIAKFF